MLIKTDYNQINNNSNKSSYNRSTQKNLNKLIIRFKDLLHKCLKNRINKASKARNNNR